MTAATHQTKAAGYIAKAMTHTAAGMRAKLLHEMMQLAIAGLVIIEGREAAAEAAYALADHVAVAS